MNSRVRSVVVIGAQWGDEGKGKIIDILSERAHYAVRFQGGHNAGHTLVVNGETLVLHLLPSSVLQSNCCSVIGNGVMLSLPALLQEIDVLKTKRIDATARLSISSSCGLIIDSHQLLDQLREQKMGRQKIGTTGRGIGPAYEDKIARRGLRLADLERPQQLREKIEALLEYHNFLLTQYYGNSPVDCNKLYDSLLTAYEKIAALVTNTSALLRRVHQQGKTMLFEGAQGAMLDIDHGTYPFVTSSNTISTAVTSGCGIGFHCVDAVVGITKAYTTRVGSGPFPSELECQIGRFLAEKGNEFGSTTGRPRRCGWLDLVALKEIIALNSIDRLCLTKLDVLDELERISVCSDYTLQGKKITPPSLDSADFSNVKPVYTSLPGWQQSITSCESYEQLPSQCQDFIAFIEEYTCCPVDIISTGAQRNEALIRRHPV